MKPRRPWLRALRPVKSKQTYYARSQQRRLSTSQGTIGSTDNVSYGAPETIQDSHVESQSVSGAFRRSHGLPLSPIMDPAMRTAVMKYRDPKPLPSKQLNTPQVKLKNNPYGRDLWFSNIECRLTTSSTCACSSGAILRYTKGTPSKLFPYSLPPCNPSRNRGTMVSTAKSDQTISMAQGLWQSRRATIPFRLSGRPKQLRPL
jgi:hypothetical protein